MVQIGNLSAWIQVDGDKVTEYATTYSPDGTEATCWIPSEAGKAFVICSKDSVRVFSSATRIFVDGNRCSAGKITHERSTGRGSSISHHPGVPISDGAYKPFIFSNCHLVEEESIATLAPGIGDIKVIIDEVIVHGHVDRKLKSGELPPLEVNERAKKGIVHGTQLGKEIHRKPKRPRKTTTIKQLVTFTFKYRPLAVLQADGIAPAPQKLARQAPVTNAEDFIDLTIEDDEQELSSNRTKRVTRRSTTLHEVKSEVKAERRPVTLSMDILDLTV